MQFVVENFLGKLLEGIAPRGDERAASVLDAKRCLGVPASKSRVHNPCPDLPALRAEMGYVLVMDLPVIPSGDGRAGAEKPVA